MSGVWGFWLLPAFLLSGTPQSEWSFAAFFLSAVAISVIVMPLFNQPRGSILLPALLHFQLINPIRPILFSMIVLITLGTLFGSF